MHHACINAYVHHVYKRSTVYIVYIYYSILYQIDERWILTSLVHPWACLRYCIPDEWNRHQFCSLENFKTNHIIQKVTWYHNHDYIIVEEFPTSWPTPSLVHYFAYIRLILFTFLEGAEPERSTCRRNFGTSSRGFEHHVGIFKTVRQISDFRHRRQAAPS